MDRELDIRLKGMEQRLEAVELAVGLATPPASRATEPTPEPKAPAPRTPPPSSRAVPPPLPATLQKAGPRPAPTPAPTPAPSPAPTTAPRPTRTMVATEGEERGFDWEAVLGAAVLGRIGVGAVLLAAGYFAQLAYRHLSDPGKVAVLYGLAATFVGVGAALRSRVSRMYVGLLWGGGVSTAYMAGVAGHLAYGLFPAPLAFVLLVGACALGQWLAHRLRHEGFAVVSLAGAFAVPLLLDVHTDSRTFLLCFVLILHTWSAWCEHAWKWYGARVAGVLGALAVGALWFGSHGGRDLSTMLHAQLLFIGLMAPELLAMWRGKPVNAERAHVGTVAVGLCAAALGLWTHPTIASSGTAGVGPSIFALVTGLVWLGLTVVLALRARGDDRREALEGMIHTSQWLVVLGGVFIAFASFELFESELLARAVPALLLAGIACLMLLVRRVLAYGDAAAATATALAGFFGLALANSIGELFAFAAAPAVAAGLLVVTGRSVAARVAGTWIGAALGLGIGAGIYMQTWNFGAADPWHVVGPALAALVLAATQLLATRRGDQAFLRIAPVAWVPVAGLWIVQAFAGRGGQIVANPGCLSGLIVAAGAAVAALRTKAPARMRDAFGCLAVVVAALVGYREVLFLPSSATAGQPHVFLTAYLLLVMASLGSASRGRWTSGRMLAAAALMCAGMHAVAAATSLAAVGVAGGALALSWMLQPRDEVAHTLLGFSAALAMAAWIAAWVQTTRDATTLPFLNGAFATGILVAGALGWAAVRTLRHTRPPTPLMAVLMLCLFTYLVGLRETWAVAERTRGVAWPAILVSLYTIVFAGGMLAVGFWQRLRVLRLIALGTFFGVVAKIGLHDLASSPLPLRILVTGALGLALLTASFAYARSGRDGPSHAA